MAPITRKFGSIKASQAQRPEPDASVQTADAEGGGPEPATLVGPRPQQVWKVDGGPGPCAAGLIHARPRDTLVAERPVQLHLGAAVPVQLVRERPSGDPVAVLHDRVWRVAEAVAGQLGTPAELDLSASTDELLVPAAERAQDLRPDPKVGAGGIWAVVQGARQPIGVGSRSPCAGHRVIEGLVVEPAPDQ